MLRLAGLLTLDLLSLSTFFTLIFQLTSSCPALAGEDKPVIIIIRSNDTDPTMSLSYSRNTSEARALYTKAGFNVIELDDSAKHPLTANMVQKAIGDVKSEELQLLFLTHGIGIDHHDFESQLSLFGHEPNGRPGQHILGSQIKTSLVRAIQRNPKLRVYIPVLSCYSGVLGEELADVPGVLVLPSSAANHFTLIDQYYDPIQGLLNNLSQNQTYAQAEESAWQEQLTQATRGTSAMGQIDLEAKTKPTEFALALLKTGPQLFVDSWCAAQSKTPWTAEQFCITDNDIKVDDALKNISIQEIEKLNQKHLGQIEDVLAETNCKDLESNPDLASFLKLKRNLVKTAVEKLKNRVAIASVEDYRKALIDQENDYIDLIQKKIISGHVATLLEKIKSIQAMGDDQLKIEMDKYKARAMGNIQSFENTCIKADAIMLYTSFKNSDDKEHACGDYFNATYGDWARFSRKDLESIPDKDFPIFGPPPPDTPVSILIAKETKAMMEVLTEMAEKYPVQVAKEFLNEDIPNNRLTFCKELQGSIKELKQNIACTEQFKSDAKNGDWARFLDLDSSSQRKLLSGGGS